MMPAETETGVDQRSADASAPKMKYLGYSLALGGIFAAALGVRLWFNFATDHANCAGCCDASEYVRNATALSGMLKYPPEFWQKFLQAALGTASASDLESVRSTMSNMKEVYQAGPVFPIFLTLSFVVAGGLFPANSLDAPVFIQSVLSAVACGLIADFTGKAWNRSAGYVAGAIAALYPGFIVNSGRLYTESFATFLVCLMLCMVVRGFFTTKNVIPRSITLGFVSACLQLTRSILVIMSVLMIPILFLQQRQARWRAALVSLLTGFACVVVPWVCFQHAAFNKGGIVVDRVGNYNLFIGSNTQTQGWLTFPYPDGHGIEKKTLPYLLGQSFKENPGRFVRLMLDKPARLFQQPWNDFRTSIGGIDYGWQTLFHQAVILLSLLGATLALFTAVGKESPSRAQLYSRFLLIGFSALHMIYALFITVPRYAVTAMPCLIAFAAAAVVSLVALGRKTPRLSSALTINGALLWAALHCNMVQPLMDTNVIHEPLQALGIQIAVKAILLLALWFLIATTYSETSGYRRLSRILLSCLMLIALPLTLIPARAAGRWFEWQKTLTDAGLTQNITIPKSLGDKQTYVMIDANGVNSLESVDVFVNGKKLTGPRIPGMALAQNYSVLQHVDGGKVTWEGENIFNFMSRPADISNADLRQWVLIPVPVELTKPASRQIQVTMKARSANPDGIVFGSYDHAKHLYIPSVITYSWEKAFYGVENPAGLTDPRLDDSFQLKRIAVKNSNVAAEPNIRLVVPSDAAVGNVELLKTVPVKDFELMPRKLSQPFSIFTMPDFSQSDYWVVRTSGDMKSNTLSARPSMTLTAVSSKGNSKYESPWTPNVLPASADWKHFEVSTPLVPSLLPGGIKQIQGKFVFDSPKWKTNRQAPEDSLQFKNVHVDIVKLPGNPIAAGYSLR